jgi:hypothetical protein
MRLVMVKSLAKLFEKVVLSGTGFVLLQQAAVVAVLLPRHLWSAHSCWSWLLDWWYLTQGSQGTRKGLIAVN